MYSHCDEKSGIRGYTDAKSAKDAKGYTEEGEGRYKVGKNSKKKPKSLILQHCEISELLFCESSFWRQNSKEIF